MGGFSARTTSLAAEDCVICFKTYHRGFSARMTSLAVDDLVIGVNPTNERLLCQDALLVAEDY
jgi:hypothetical protein